MVARASFRFRLLQKPGKEKAAEVSLGGSFRVTRRARH
jgi:hypothetical protein